jgi:hypothetical protein
MASLVDCPISCSHHIVHRRRRRRCRRGAVSILVHRSLIFLVVAILVKLVKLWRSGIHFLHIGCPTQSPDVGVGTYILVAHFDTYMDLPSVVVRHTPIVIEFPHRIVAHVDKLRSSCALPSGEAHEK